MICSLQIFVLQCSFFYFLCSLYFSVPTKNPSDSFYSDKYFIKGKKKAETKRGWQHEEYAGPSKERKMTEANPPNPYPSYIKESQSNIHSWNLMGTLKHQQESQSKSLEITSSTCSRKPKHLQRFSDSAPATQPNRQQKEQLPYFFTNTA